MEFLPESESAKGTSMNTGVVEAAGREQSEVP